MKTLARLGLLSLLAACGGGQDDAGTNGDAMADPRQEEPTLDLAAPVTQPIEMRRFLHRQLDEQREKARAREDAFERVLPDK